MQAAESAAEALKLEGDGAFREGRLEEAYQLYSSALDLSPEDASILCNRSFAAFKLEQYTKAEEDAAEAVESILRLPDAERPIALLTKVYSRKAQAQMASGRPVTALRTYMEGLAKCPGAEQLSAAARLALDTMPVPWLAKYWTLKVMAAEKPHALSSRDGVLLRPVPSQRRLPSESARAHLELALEESEELQEESKDLICTSWIQGHPPRRAETAFFRGVIYLQAGDPEQAEKDATVALVYGPQAGGRESAWPAALLLRSAALEARGSNIPAAIDAARASELDPESSRAAAALDRLFLRIPEHYVAAVQSGGAAALEALLQVEKERAMPEIMKSRPKYYYYYEWMRKRIEARHPALPDLVMDKLLTMDATELDLLLQYPAAVDQTVANLFGVLENGGEEALAGHAVPLLSWEQVQELQSIGAGEDNGVAALPAPKPILALEAPENGNGIKEGEEEEVSVGGAGDEEAALLQLDEKLFNLD